MARIRERWKPWSRIRIALATAIAFGCGCSLPGTPTTFFCYGFVRPSGIGGKLWNRSGAICNMGRKKAILTVHLTLTQTPTVALTLTLNPNLNSNPKPNLNCNKKVDVLSKQEEELSIDTKMEKSCTPVGLDETTCKGNELEDLKAGTSVPPWVDDMNRWIVGTLKSGFDVFFQNRDYARFYALEKIARSPYMSYVSILVRDTHAYLS